MYNVSQPISDVLVELDLAPNLLPASFTISLFLNGDISLVPVTIQQIVGKPGFYKITFTPDAEGLWSLDIIVTSKPKIRYQGAYTVRDIEDAVADTILEKEIPSFNTPGSMADYLNKTKKYTSNRVLISGASYIIKEDDGLTDFETGEITPFERKPD